MAASSSNSALFTNVVEDVIAKVRDECISSGASESVLLELQALWETKMFQCGVICSTPKQAAGQNTPVHDLNVPYDGDFEGSETPTAEMLFPPTPLHEMNQSPLPGTANSPHPGIGHTPLLGIADRLMYNTSRRPTQFSPANDPKYGRPSPFMQPPSPWMNRRPLGVDVNVAHMKGRDDLDATQQTMKDVFMRSSGKRKRDEYASQFPSETYFSQLDGSGDVAIELSFPKANQTQNSSKRFNKETEIADTLSLRETNALPFLPQQDGAHDDDSMVLFEGVAHEDYNAAVDDVELRIGTPSVGTPKPVKSEVLDDEEPPLNEDDDDEEDLDELGLGEEPNTQHLVLAQFERVSRLKSRWKCILKGGMMDLNNRVILFNKGWIRIVDRNIPDPDWKARFDPYCNIWIVNRNILTAILKEIGRSISLVVA